MTEQEQINDLIRMKANSICDGYINTADPNLGADGAYVGSYFFDRTHPTTLGHQEIAAILSRYIDSVGGATASNPTVQSASSYAMQTGDNYIDATITADSTWTLPECIGLTGKIYTVSNQGSGVLTLTGAHSEAINGPAVLKPNDTAKFEIALTSDATGGCPRIQQ